MAYEYEWIPPKLIGELLAYGCTVVQWAGWSTRAAYGPEVRPFTPVGLVNHHTAGRADYDPARLLTKCNLYVSPEGVTYVLAAGYQADSGMGDPNALYRVRNDQEPQAPRDFTADDRINGNPWFIDVEVGHLGDGSPIPKVQRDELVRVDAAVCSLYGWDAATRLIGHKEWTRRKVDPRWSYQGKLDTMEDLRFDVVSLMEDTVVKYLKADLHAMVAAAFDVGGAQGDEAWWHSFIDDLESYTPEEVQAELFYLYRELFN